MRAQSHAAIGVERRRPAGNHRRRTRGSPTGSTRARRRATKPDRNLAGNAVRRRRERSAGGPSRIRVDLEVGVLAETARGRIEVATKKPRANPPPTGNRPRTCPGREEVAHSTPAAVPCDVCGSGCLELLPIDNAVVDDEIHDCILPWLASRPHVIAHVRLPTRGRHRTLMPTFTARGGVARSYHEARQISSCSQRERGRGRPRGHAELAKMFWRCRRDGVVADDEPGGDRAVALPARDQAQHLELALRQARGDRPVAARPVSDSTRRGPAQRRAVRTTSRRDLELQRGRVLVSQRRAGQSHEHSRAGGLVRRLELLPRMPARGAVRAARRRRSPSASATASACVRGQRTERLALLTLCAISSSSRQAPRASSTSPIASMISM